MQVWFLGQEDHLEEGIATHSSLLVWRVPIDRGAWQATVHRSQRVRHNWSILACTQADKNIKLKCYYKTDKVILTYVMCCRRLLRVPWIARRSNQSILKEISPGLFIGRTDAEPETPILWPPHAKSWLIGKDPDAGRDWEQEEKGMTEDEMAEWHHWLDGHGFGWTPGVGDGQGSLACCDSWGLKESDTTERLNWTDDLKV